MLVERQKNLPYLFLGFVADALRPQLFKSFDDDDDDDDSDDDGLSQKFGIF